MQGNKKWVISTVVLALILVGLLGFLAGRFFSPGGTPEVPVTDPADNTGRASEIAKKKLEVQILQVPETPERVLNRVQARRTAEPDHPERLELRIAAEVLAGIHPQRSLL